MSNAAHNPQGQRDALLPLLHASRECFLASFAGVSETDCRRKPNEDSWSVLDCVEHIAVAETGMLFLLHNMQAPRPAGAPNREQLFLDFMGSRERKVQSPEIGRPAGRFPTLAAACKQFEVSRAGTMKYLQDCVTDLRATEVMHPHPLVGVVSSYEMVIIMARHAERHALQIQEICKSQQVQAARS